MSGHTYTLSELSEKLNARLVGDGSSTISGIAPLYRAKGGDITFLLAAVYKPYLDTTEASAIVLSEENLAGFKGNALVVPDPNVSYAKLAALFEPSSDQPAGIHPTAIIPKSASVDSSVSIGAYCVIGEHTVIGPRTRIAHGTIIGDNCQIGEACRLAANVTLYEGVKVKDRVIIHSGVVIGADGFGLVNDRGRWLKIPQLGGVSISSDVEIGANTTIDRGSMDDTILEEGVKLDNQIQIAHNVVIGAHTAIAACVGIAGSTKIGKHCMIGGASNISDHVIICDQVILTGATSVLGSLSEPGVYSSGIPAQPRVQWHRQVLRSRQLDQLFSRVKKLEKSIHE